MEDKRLKTFLRSLLYDKTVWLAAIPTIVFVCTYSYELGIATMWGVPFYLIKPEPSEFAYTLIAIVFFVSAYRYAKWLFSFSPTTTISHNGIVFIVVYMVMLAFIAGYLYEMGFIGINVLCFVLLVGVLVAAIALSIYKIMGYMNANAGPSHFNWVITYSLVLLFGSFLVGVGSTVSSSFFIVHNPMEYVVINKYEGYFVCRTFDRKKKYLGDKLVLIPMSDTKLEISYEKIGPLRVTNN